MERPARRVVWPVAPDVPASPLKAGRGRHGEPILRVKRAFESCVVDAGLKDQVSPHWLRHTSATWLMEQNADPWDAAGFLGMSVITLVRHYGHHRPSFQDDVRNRFGSSKPGTIPGTNTPEKPRHLKVV